MKSKCWMLDVGKGRWIKLNYFSHHRIADLEQICAFFFLLFLTRYFFILSLYPSLPHYPLCQKKLISQFSCLWKKKVLIFIWKISYWMTNRRLILFWCFLFKFGFCSSNFPCSASISCCCRNEKVFTNFQKTYRLTNICMLV